MKDMDILKDRKELKEMPFSTPEGYFDDLRSRLKKPVVSAPGLWDRFAPYAAVAAVFLFLVSAGTFLLERSTPESEMTQEDYIMFSDNLMNTIDYEIYSNSQIAEAGIEDEDIINYLIYTGVTIEEIEKSESYK